MGSIELSKNIQNTYNEQYNNDINEWRELGAKYKAQNILTVTNNNTFNKVLEFGAGEGSILNHLNATNFCKDLYALEISDSGIEQIKKRALKKVKSIEKFDGYKSNFSDNKFDLVYCSHVLEHVEHPRLVLREIKRISKQQVFEIPLDYSKNVDTKIEHFLSYGHINIYTPSTFKFLLKSEGFEIKKEVHSTINKKMLEFMWYKNSNLKKTPLKTLKAMLLSHKLKIAQTFLGKKIANEFYASAYTCFTCKVGNLAIFNS